ncbi:FAD-binding oxidoreductase [Herbaspirillum sp. YR522]|uniref:FAD-binding oxidoreductase n=1 Tax=Herbaspirillum sp. YR522 TaxID=1144342 RepID=UPI00026FCDA3|nr:FAD-binding oxidoreductase [Herbaspirillum sp. YR522]EJM99706.1 FAD/FMN-dependent dehydrogenase [Herbaspirillum sp. YR522]
MRDSNALPRRNFLQAGAALLYAGSYPGSLNAAPALHSPKNLRALGRSLHGRLVLPGEMGYAMAAAPNNARYADILPLAVAMCADAHDVQLCLRWAAEHRQQFAIRSGGHNYAGFSTTRGLLIDVKAMNKVWYDLDKNRGYIQAGACNQDMADAFSGTNFAIPSGRCPTVGASGLVLGGGWGFSATHAGLTCDSLVQTDVVLANGQHVSVDDRGDYRDLFWALRGGGGGNFGVNTAFSFELHEVKDDVTIFNIVWPGEKQIELLMALQDIQRNHACQISTRTKAYPDAPGAHPKHAQLLVATLGQFFGPREKALEALAPALKLVKPSKSDIRQMSYWQARDYLITDDPNGMYDVRSSYVADGLPREALERMLHWMTKWPGGSLLPQNMGILFAIGGKVRDVACDATAYVHRNANYIFEMESAWAPIDSPDVVRRQQAWLSEYFAAMQPFMLRQSYVNFPSRELPHWANAYYGTNLARLMRVKKKYDPGNLFTFEQSIPPA